MDNEVSSIVMAQSPQSTGKVLAVRGGVVDVAFEGVGLPKLHDALVVEWDQPEPLVIEVQAHLDDRTVRAVALQATAGLQRGVPVRSTGGPVTVPVGEPVLGRLLDVTGRVRETARHFPLNCPVRRSTGLRRR